jgi:hypothetical protein
MAYDSVRQAVLLFGGFSGGLVNPTALSDTWLYSTLSPAASQAFGTGCGGTNGTPILTSSVPYLGHPAFGLELVAARPSSACVFALSAAQQSLPIGPCTLYLRDLAIPMLAVSNVAGYAEAPRFAIPVDVGLRGLVLYGQAFVVDPSGGVLGLAFSAGNRLSFGD